MGVTPAQVAGRVIRQPALLNALKTECKNGHPLVGENLHVKRRGDRTERVCRTCRRKAHLDRTRALAFASNPTGPDPATVDAGLPVDVWKRIQVDSERGCWLWQGGLSASGYGRTTHGTGRTRYTATHRLTYERLVGPIPNELELDHLCRVRHCCNPEHLEPVTHRENMRRGLVARRMEANAL